MSDQRKQSRLTDGLTEVPHDKSTVIKHRGERLVAKYWRDLELGEIIGNDSGQITIDGMRYHWNGKWHYPQVGERLPFHPADPSSKAIPMQKQAYIALQKIADNAS